MLNDNSFEIELSTLVQQGLLRSLPSSGKSTVVNLSSNDYLGLSHHPLVIDAAKKAIDRFGTGGTSSRLLACPPDSGDPYRDLESQLATFLNKETALVFSSGYHVNTGLLSTLAGPDDVIFFDRLCHASIIDGIRLSRATFWAFDHNDMDDLEFTLRKRREGRHRAWIVTEGFFSMDGDAPKLREIVDLSKKWGALTYIDEAHSFGVTGPEGRGVAAHLGLLSDIDVFVGTLSKSLGSQGGFVAVSKTFHDLLVSRCRSFIYTTALAPAAAAAAQAALSLLPSIEDRRKKVNEEAERLRSQLQKMGFNCLGSVSPIVPIWTGDIETTRALSDHLLSHGFFVPSIRPPTVRPGEGRVRLSVTYDVADGHVENVIRAFANYSERPSRTGDKVVKKG